MFHRICAWLDKRRRRRAFDRQWRIAESVMRRRRALLRALGSA